MRKIAIYGKGGSGKSTISAALSVSFARQGLRVLHVGCDPKADSTFTIVGGRRIRTLLDLLGEGNLRPKPADFIVPGRFGIDCIEAGGPRPGAGCGGRGIARMFELFEDLGLVRDENYDVVVFDVLGDVVCGGFAAPLRLGFADRAFIVVSEEPLSLYAANNIAHAIVTYGANGVRLGGLIMNVSDDLAAVGLVERFAESLGTRVAGVIPRDKEIQRIERAHRTAAELPEDSPTAAAMASLARAVLDACEGPAELPSPLAVEALFELLSPGDEPPPLSEPSAADESCCVEPADAAPAPPPSPPVPTVARKLPQDRIIQGGTASLAAFATLLGVRRKALAELHLEMEEVVCRRGRIFATVHGPALGRLTLEFRPEDGDGGYAKVNDVLISHATPLNRPTRTLLDHFVERVRRADVRFGHLEEVFLRDAGAQVQASQEVQADGRRRAVGFAPRHWSVWGNEGTRGVFLFEQERGRQVQSLLHLGDGALRVHHGTEVCQASEIEVAYNVTHFVRHPWILREERREVEEGASQYLTNITDYELIAGSNDNLTAALDAILERGGDAPVVVDVSCTPVIAGEDWAGAVKRFKAAYPGLVIAQAVGATDLSTALVQAGLEALADAPGEAESPTGILLVGFPETPFTDELVSLLEEAGIPVRGRQLPGLSLAGLRRYREAKAMLAWPQVEYEQLYRDLFQPLDRPFLEAVPPFGMAGTEAFVRQAAEAAGVAPEAALGRVRERLTAAAAELESLREEAASHRVGIALTARQANLLDGPATLCGVPVVTSLEGLGFQVEVLNDSQDLARLQWWLGSGLSLVYSDLSRDGRLQELGLPWFSLADLEAGPEGAVRTLRRLLRRAGIRFFRNYGRYVGRG